MIYESIKIIIKINTIRIIVFLQKQGYVWLFLVNIQMASANKRREKNPIESLAFGGGKLLMMS